MYITLYLGDALHAESSQVSYQDEKIIENFYAMEFFVKCFQIERQLQNICKEGKEMRPTVALKVGRRSYILASFWYDANFLHVHSNMIVH